MVTITRALGLALIAWSESVLAQQTLGEMLDAGATRLSAARFRHDVVARTVHGPTEIGLDMNVVYRADGVVEGVGWPPGLGNSIAWTADIAGTWRFDEDGRVCTAIILNGATIRASYPERCRYWFKLVDRYYVADSVQNRNAEVFVRMVDAVPRDAAAGLRSAPSTISPGV